MKINLFSAIVILSAGLSLSAAESCKDDVIKAAKALGNKENYSWRTTTVVPENAMFKPGPVEGKTEKDGHTVLNISFGDNDAKAVLKGEKGAATNPDGEWKTLAELAEEEGPIRFLAIRLQTFKAPAAQAAQLAADAKALKQEGEICSGELTEEGAKSILAFRPRGGGEVPTLSNAKGSVKFWLKDGALTKYEFNVKGTMNFNGNDVEQDRTSTVVIKEIGSTKVSVPEEAKKKLS